MQNTLSFKQKICLGIIATLFVVNILVWQHVFALSGPHYLTVDVLDVGQGDSIFIETPSMRHILIDGGPDSSVLTKLATKLPFWQRKLDVVVLTHPDADHVVGLIQVLKKYQVDYIIWTGMVRDGANYQAWRQMLLKKQQEGSKIIMAKLNTTIASGDVTLKTLHPFENVEGQTFKEANDTGIVSLLAYAKSSFLFTADVSSNIEQALLDNNSDLNADVLKVGHHGSKYSTQDTFLQAVTPNFAVISVGVKNSYGHPTAEVLQRLQEFGIKTLRTDQQGTVEFLSDGNIINVKTNMRSI
jgi:competence protein ComEC